MQKPPTKKTKVFADSQAQSEPDIFTGVKYVKPEDDAVVLLDLSNRMYSTFPFPVLPETPNGVTNNETTQNDDHPYIQSPWDENSLCIVILIPCCARAHLRLPAPPQGFDQIIPLLPLLLCLQWAVSLLDYTNH